MRNVCMRRSRGSHESDLPAFLFAEPGDFVAIVYFEDDLADWWVGQVIHRVGSSSDPTVNTLFQVIDIDTGIVKTVNADFVRGIV